MVCQQTVKKDNYLIYNDYYLIIGGAATIEPLCDAL